MLNAPRGVRRPLWAGLLGALAALPPAAAAEAVSDVHARLARAGPAVAARLRAAPFSDAVLGQVGARAAGELS